jgi:hypothetical protein
VSSVSTHFYWLNIGGHANGSTTYANITLSIEKNITLSLAGTTSGSDLRGALNLIFNSHLLMLDGSKLTGFSAEGSTRQLIDISDWGSWTDVNGLPRFYMFGGAITGNTCDGTTSLIRFTTSYLTYFTFTVPVVMKKGGSISENTSGGTAGNMFFDGYSNTLVPIPAGNFALPDSFQL